MIVRRWVFRARVYLWHERQLPSIEVLSKTVFESLPGTARTFRSETNGVGTGLTLWTKTVCGIEYKWFQKSWRRPPRNNKEAES